jgi:ABC-type lipoprotein release transport system permease subunit
MSDSVGRAAVRFAFRYLRHRYRREIRIGIAVAVIAVGAGVLLAARRVPEG